MFSLIFAITFIFTTTVVLTVAAMAIVQWMLERQQQSAHVQTQANAALEEQTRASSAML